MDYVSETSLGARLLAVIGLLTAAFLLLPLVILAVQSFTAESYLAFPPPEYSLRWYREVLTSQDWRAAAATSLTIAAVTTPLAVILGSMTSLALDRHQPDHCGGHHASCRDPRNHDVPGA